MRKREKGEDRQRLQSKPTNILIKSNEAKVHPFPQIPTLELG